MSVLVAARDVGAMESVKKLNYYYLNLLIKIGICVLASFLSPPYFVIALVTFCVDSSLDLKIHFSVVGIYKNSRIIVKVNKCWRKK